MRPAIAESDKAVNGCLFVWERKSRYPAATGRGAWWVVPDLAQKCGWLGRWCLVPGGRVAGAARRVFRLSGRMSRPPLAESPRKLAKLPSRTGDGFAVRQLSAVGLWRRCAGGLSVLSSSGVCPQRIAGLWVVQVRAAAGGGAPGFGLSTPSPATAAPNHGPGPGPALRHRQSCRPRRRIGREMLCCRRRQHAHAPPMAPVRAAHLRRASRSGCWAGRRAAEAGRGRRRPIGREGARRRALKRHSLGRSALFPGRRARSAASALDGSWRRFPA